MDRLRRARRYVGWLALAAMLTLVAAPTLSRLTGPGQGSWSLSQICSATKPMSQGPAGETGSRNGVQHQACCALCAFGMAALPTPSGAGVVARVSDRSPRIAPAIADASKSLREWVHARPRGPPAPV
jgi:hypothetical protein